MASLAFRSSALAPDDSGAVSSTFCRAREALDFLEAHQLEPSPILYELALTYVGGTSPDLAHEIDEQTEGGYRLSGTEADALATRFLAKSDPGLDRREKAVARQTRHLGFLASEAHAMASCLERDVATAVSQARERPEAASEIVTRLAEAERELAELRDNIAKLQARVDRARDGRCDVSGDALSHSLDRDEVDELVHSLTNDGRRYVLIMFGLDDQAEYASKYSASVCENILNSLGNTLRQTFEGHCVLRWSDSHFIIILKDTAVMAARALAEEALYAMSQRRLRLRDSGEPVGMVTASAGIVVGQSEQITDILEQAGANLASAVESGGNRVSG